MKRLSAPLFSALAISLLLLLQTSCGKLSGNGAIDGMWQIQQIDYLRPNQSDSVVNAMPLQAYLSFQLDLAKIHWLGVYITNTNVYLLRFQHTGDELRLYEFYRHYTSTDSLITSDQAFMLQPFGIDHTDVTFQIEELSGRRMKLCSDHARLHLRKY